VAVLHRVLRAPLVLALHHSLVAAAGGGCCRCRPRARLSPRGRGPQSRDWQRP
jgi:hypothetical protein